MNATGRNITYKKINGDTNGTISDTDGAYEIALPDGGVDLLFSYIGYENERLPLMLRKGISRQKMSICTSKPTCWGMW